MQKNKSSASIDEQHRRLVEAIINRDENEAERCMSQHMVTVEEIMAEMLAEKRIKPYELSLQFGKTNSII